MDLTSHEWNEADSMTGLRREGRNNFRRNSDRLALFRLCERAVKDFVTYNDTEILLDSFEFGNAYMKYVGFIELIIMIVMTEFI